MKLPIHTTDAFLPARGLNNRRATLHRYSHSELVTLPGAERGTTVTGLGHFFRCTETGELRRWGFDALHTKEIVN